ncbi:MAG: c-type cytochrome [Candidatus Scalindua sp.]
MKKHSNVYTILIVFLLFIQQIISGCATTVTKDVQKEELIRGDSHKEELVKEELHKEKAGLVSQKLYEGKCSPCHVLPDIDAYGYTPEQWVKIIDGMHNPADYSAFITSEEDKKIKDYLKNMSQKK